MTCERPPRPRTAPSVIGVQTVDVLVVGAGLAGLHTAQRLARHGLDVLVVDSRRSLSTGIRTTGIFVRRTLEDLEIDLPDHLLGPGIRQVLVYPPSRRKPVRLTSDRDEFRVGDMPAVYAYARRAAEAAGARVMLGVRYTGATGGLVGLAGAEPVLARFLIGADGPRSRVAHDLGLDHNQHFLVGAETVHPVAPDGSDPAFHCVLDPRVAPGYLGWVVNDGHHAHIGVAGHPALLPAGIRQALTTFATDAPGHPLADGSGPVTADASGTFTADALGRRRPANRDEALLGHPDPAGGTERRGGLIRVGGVLRRIACPAGLLVGDAAGAVSPLTAGGLDLGLRMSALAADVTADYLRARDHHVLRRYDGHALRSGYRGRLLLRRLLTAVRSPAAAEAALIALRTGPGRAAAARVLFDPGP